MTVPVFEERAPVSDCDCPGCAQARRTAPRALPGRAVGRAVGCSAACGLVVVAVASAVLGAVTPAAALTAGRPAVQRPHVSGDGEPETPQGATAPLHGRGGRPDGSGVVRLPATTRTAIIKRAQVWVAAQVPYSMNDYWSDGYRQDCSGYVSMAWDLGTNEWTGSLDQFGVKITKEELEPGDILLYHNPDNPERGSHVVIFGGWTDYTHTYYTVYEQTPPHTRSQATPYPYWSNTGKYVPYRYKGLTPDTPATPGTAGAPVGDRTNAAYPGADSFGPGVRNGHVTLLGRMLAERGGGASYTTGPGPTWGEADRRATRAFQLAQGWTGDAADGLPGPRTWELLVTGKGKGKGIGGRKAVPGAAGSVRAVSYGMPGHPGRNHFLPGAENEYVTRLGRRLVEKGYGGFYPDGPGPVWGEADRRAVAAFQRAQGRRAAAADGYPDPETWRRLFADAGPQEVTGL